MTEQKKIDSAIIEVMHFLCRVMDMNDMALEHYIRLTDESIAEICDKLSMPHAENEVTTIIFDGFSFHLIPLQ